MAIVVIILGVISFFLVGPRIIISVAVLMFMGYLLCDIDPEKAYSWYSGIWHGMFFVPNYLRHVFHSDVLYKANEYTSAYNVYWWIFTVISSIGTLFGGSGRK